MLPRLADTVNHATRNSLTRELTKCEAKMITGAKVTSISGNKVNYTKDGTGSSIEGDTLVLTLVEKPRTKLYDDLRPLVFKLSLFGDANEPGLIVHAVRKGFYATYCL